jgi:hypothetical protein
VRVPVLVRVALDFFGDSHAAISGGIIVGTGIKCSMNVRALMNLLKGRHPAGRNAFTQGPKIQLAQTIPTACLCALASLSI